MGQLDPTVLMLALLAASVMGSRLDAMRHVAARLALVTSILTVWGAFLLYLSTSGGSNAIAMFGWSDEHQLLSEFQRLHVLMFSFSVGVPLFSFGISVILLRRAVLADRGLTGQLIANLRIIAQLPHNLTTLLVRGTSDTPHGPPSSAFVLSVGIAG